MHPFDDRFSFSGGWGLVSGSWLEMRCAKSLLPVEESVLCEFGMSQGQRPIVSLSRGVWVFSFFSILFGAWNSAYPAGVRISSLTIGSNNIPRIEHDASSNYYYLL